MDTIKHTIEAVKALVRDNSNHIGFFDHTILTLALAMPGSFASYFSRTHRNFIAQLNHMLVSYKVVSLLSC